MIVGIESSCDESAVALFDGKSGILCDEIASQIDLHSEYGGVVPELASREHAKNFIPLLKKLQSFPLKMVKFVAATNGPGLPGCVSMGVAAAGALSLALGVPAIGINHLHGHLFSPFIAMHSADPGFFFENFKKELPHIGLLVSGGNTALFTIGKDLSVAAIAETQDDAAGEAFDKGAKLLGLPYPGGALVEKFAKAGNPKRYNFPRAFCLKSEMKFSFSGLKTSLRYFLEKSERHSEKMDSSERSPSANLQLQRQKTSDEMSNGTPINCTQFASNCALNDICASYQEAIIDALAIKLSHALELYPCASVGLSGGVANNECLRQRIAVISEKFRKNFIASSKRHSGDNAAMIAFAAYLKAQNWHT